MNCRQIVSSKGCKRGGRPLIARRMVYPSAHEATAANAACSLVLAKEERQLSSDFRAASFS